MEKLQYKEGEQTWLSEATHESAPLCVTMMDSQIKVMERSGLEWPLKTI